MFLMGLQTEQQNTEREFTYQKPPPPIEWHLPVTKDKFDLLTVSSFSCHLIRCDFCYFLILTFHN